MSARELDPELAAAIAELMNQFIDYQPRITSRIRTRSQQARLYARYLAGVTPYPVAPPGRSKHERGLAVDLVVSDMDVLPYMGAVWESWGGIWGGRFGDEIHFELPD